jgi:abortive infection bacteriophage resistance protein
MTYYLSKAYGPFGYANPINFSPDFNHSEWFTNVEDEISRSRENFITHYRIKYTKSEYFPIWMATEVFSFGSLSKLYRGLQFKDKKIIAEHFTIHAPVFQSWLHCLVYLRNLCAHHSRLWNRELAIQPQLPKKDLRWHIPFEIKNNRIFCLLTILHYCFRVLGTDCLLKNQIIPLLEKYPNIPLLPMGMNKDWPEHTIWKI